MRFILLFLVAVLLVPIHASVEIGERIEVEISESEVLSLYYFMRAASGEPHTNERLKTIWNEHADKEANAALARAKSALAAGPGGFSYHARVKERSAERHLGRSLNEVLEAHAGESSSIEDFGVRMTGLLPVAEQATFIEALQQIEPLHRKHVWKPSRAFLPGSVKALRRAAKKHQLEKRFAEAAKFYGARWPGSVPIRIYLVGVPGEVERTHAHSAGPIEVVEVVDGDDIESRLAVLFHELCHSLYDAQPIEKQLAVEKSFRAHPLPDASVAYAQFNEGLATALGNGWLEVSMRGEKVLEEEWYANEMVDGFAKALYPLVTWYLEQEKEIDVTSVNYAVARFVLEFPDAVRKPEIVFRSAFLGMSPRFDARSIIDAFRLSLRTNSLWSSQPLAHEKTMEQYRRGLPAVMVVDSKTVADELAGYPDALARGVEKHVASRGPFLYVRNLENRWHVIVVADERAAAVAAFERLASLERLEDGLVVRVETD